MIICTACGNHNEDDDEFCGSCGKFLEWVGEKVEEPPPPEPEPEPEPEPAKAGLMDRVKAAVGMDETAREGAADAAPPASPASSQGEPSATGAGPAGGAPPASPSASNGPAAAPPSDPDDELRRAAEEAAAAEARREAEERAARDAAEAEAAAQARREAQERAARDEAEAAAAAAAQQEAKEAEAARRAADEAAAEAARQAEEAAAAQRAAEAAAAEQARREAEEREAAEQARRETEEAEAARRRAEESAAAGQAHADAEQMRAADAARQQAEAEARREAQEAAAAEQARLEAEEAAQRAAIEAAAAEEERRRRVEAEAEAARQQAAAEEQARREAEEAERARREAEAAAAAEAERQRAEEEARRQAEEARRKEEEAKAEAARRAAALLARPKSVTPSAPAAAPPPGRRPRPTTPAPGREHADAQSGQPAASTASPDTELTPEAASPEQTPDTAAAPAAAASAAVRPQAQRPTAQQPTKGKRPPRPAPKQKVQDQPLKPGDLVCGQCGQGNDPTRKFCRKCGNSLAEAAPAAKVPWYKRLFSRKSKPAKAGSGKRGKTQAKQLARSAQTAGWKANRVLGMARRGLLMLALVGIAVPLALPNLRSSLFDKAGDFATWAKGVVLPAEYETVNPITAVASSQTPEHPAPLAIDLGNNTYWSEGAPAEGIGESIAIEFDGTTNLDRVIVTPGATEPANQYLAQPRPRELRLVFDDGQPGPDGRPPIEPQTIELSDEPKAQTFTLKSVENVRKVTFFIVSVYKGQAGEDTSIAELEFRREKQ